MTKIKWGTQVEKDKNHQTNISILEYNLLEVIWSVNVKHSDCMIFYVFTWMKHKQKIKKTQFNWKGKCYAKKIIITVKYIKISWKIDKKQM